MSSSRRTLARLARLGLTRLRRTELFDAWTLAETEASLALTAWRSARSDEKAAAHSRYLAALEREAQAAMTLQLRLAPAAT
jgi:hypothetical protein